MMDLRVDSHSNLKQIVGEALDLTPRERAGFLGRVCANDSDLHRQAAELLGLESAAGDFLEDSPMRQVEFPPLQGARLGAYRLMRLLGSGGMGDVYLAERADGTFDQRVAVKVIRARGGLGELEERFASERQLMAELKHPNIAFLLDGGTTDDGRPYLVMEYVDGQPIDAYCKDQDLSVEERLRLFLEVCAVVEHAHRHLVIHRDLKPANILVTAAGGPKLLDFGVAKHLGVSGKTPETRLLVPVTPEYASPEQLTGQPATTSFDVYALGVVLYELLVGESPFGDSDPLSGRSHDAPPTSPSARVQGHSAAARRLRRRLAGDLDFVVLRALEPDSAKRYSSVEQFSRDLERHVQGLALETRGGRLYRLGKAAHRNWRSLVVAVAVVVLAGFWLDAAFERRQLARQNQQVVELSEGLGKYMEDVFKAADPARSGEWSDALERMLERGAKLLETGDSADKPLMRARLLGAIGQVYRSHDRLDEAVPLLRESLEIRRRHLEPDDEWIAVACSNLAIALRDQGILNEARLLLWEARSLLRRHYQEDHLKIAILLNNLAGVEKDLGEFDQAIDHYREALAMKRRLGVKTSSIAMAIKNLGTGFRAAGRFVEAEASFREALRELNSITEANPAYRAGTEYHLGSLLREHGALVEARRLLERSYEARVELYGQSHRKVAETSSELARLDQCDH